MSAPAAATAVVVAARFRPENRQEAEAAEDDLTYLNGELNLQFSDDQTAVQVDFSGTTQPVRRAFGFSAMYQEHAENAEIYEELCEPKVEAMLEGYNAAVIAYGQTGSGKTHTMLGARGGADLAEGDGMIPRMCYHIFRRCRERQRSAPGLEYDISCSFIEIYLERVQDLLRPELQTASGGGWGHAALRRQVPDLKIETDVGGQGQWVVGVTEVQIRSGAEAMAVMRRGEQVRTTASTGSNETSSRSHALFIVTVRSHDSQTMMSKSAQLYLVDLAGSERVSKTETEGLRRQEAQKINQSLLALGKVITALADAAKPKAKRAAKKKAPKAKGGGAGAVPASESSDSESETQSDSDDEEPECGTSSDDAEMAARPGSALARSDSATRPGSAAAGGASPAAARPQTAAPKSGRGKKSKKKAKMEKKHVHIPYRDSKLTRILSNAFGGSSRTVVICCVSASAFNAHETISTLRFGDRSQQIQNTSFKNESRTAAELELLLSQSEGEVMQLKMQVQALLEGRDPSQFGQSNAIAPAPGGGASAPLALTAPTLPKPATSNLACREQLVAVDPRLLKRGLNIASLTCPITGSVFLEPVVAIDGHCYERSAIKAFWKTNGLFSPITSKRLNSKLLVPNHAARAMVASVFPGMIEKRAICYASFLPLEILDHVFSFIDSGRDHAAAMRVCSEWREVLRPDNRSVSPFRRFLMQEFRVELDFALADSVVLAEYAKQWAAAATKRKAGVSKHTFNSSPKGLQLVLAGQ